MIVETFPVGMLGCNCVILGDTESGEAIVVDPGGDGAKILERLRALSLRCTAIIHTHTHFDHVGATREVQEASAAPAMIHEDDLFLYAGGGLQMQLDAFRIPMTAPEPVEIERFLVDGDSVRAGGLEAGVLHTPGHTPGSLCFTVAGDTPLVIAGDTLFQGGVGRTDLWGGDSATMMRSIQRRLLTLPDETRVIAGHGPSTTIGAERRHNPYL